MHGCWAAWLHPRCGVWPVVGSEGRAEHAGAWAPRCWSAGGRVVAAPARHRPRVGDGRAADGAGCRDAGPWPWNKALWDAQLRPVDGRCPCAAPALWHVLVDRLRAPALGLCMGINAIPRVCPGLGRHCVLEGTGPMAPLYQAVFVTPLGGAAARGLVGPVCRGLHRRVLGADEGLPAHGLAGFQSEASETGARWPARHGGTLRLARRPHGLMASRREAAKRSPARATLGAHQRHDAGGPGSESAGLASLAQPDRHPDDPARG